MADLLQVMAGMILSPADVFRQLRLRLLLLWGIVIAVTAQIPWVFLYIALLPKERTAELGANGLLMFALTNLGGRLLLLVLLYALILWGISRFLGGGGGLLDMLQVTCFSNVPAFLIVPFLFIGIGLGEKGLSFLNILRLVMEFWFFLLVVIGVREMQEFTTWRAIMAAVILPFIVVMIIGAVIMGSQVSKYLPKTPGAGGEG